MQTKVSSSSKRGVNARAVVLSFMAGVALLQAAWILTIPAFRGIDETDHTYRAASVARGHVGPGSELVPDGRGYEVRVPPDLVEAALPACSQLRYVGRGNCYAATAPDDEGDVGIASASSLYMPTYYAVVGWPSLLLSGEQAQYGMRVMSAILCDLVLLAVVLVAVNRARPAWPLAAIMVCLTPTVVYASIIVAPNGLSMVGGFLTWTAWLSTSPNQTGRQNARYVAIGTAGGVVTTLTHNTGPIWVIIAAVCTAIVWGRSRPDVGLQRSLAGCAAALIAAFTTALTWALVTGANSTAGEWNAPRGSPATAEVVFLPVRWLFQSVFGAPRPGGLTSGLVYGLAFCSIFFLCAAGFAVATRGIRIAMVLVTTVLLVLPLALTWRTYSDLGFAWQGRYGIALGVGTTLLAAEALRRSRPFPRGLVSAVLVLGVVALGAAHSARTNVADEDAVFLAPAWVSMVMCATAFAAWGISLLFAASAPGRLSPQTTGAHLAHASGPSARSTTKEEKDGAPRW